MATVNELLGPPPSDSKPSIKGLLGEPTKEAAPKEEAAPKIKDILGEEKPELAPREKGAMAAIQPIQEIYPETKKAFMKGAEEFYQGFDDIRRKEGVLGKGLGALEMVGGAFNQLFSPLTGTITALAGNPIERSTGIRGAGEKIGDYGSLGVQMFYGTPLLKPLREGVETLGKAAPIEAVRTMFAPESLYPKAKINIVEPGKREFTTTEAKAAASNVRARTGELARAKEQAAYSLQEASRVLSTLPDGSLTATGFTPNSKLAMIDAIEMGAYKELTDPNLVKAADDMRKLLDFWKGKVQSLGKGFLSRSIENYFPHIWKNAGANPRAVEDSLAAEYYSATKKLKGSKAFLKQRTIGSTAEGISRGLVPVSMNPVDLTLIKVHEMQQFYYGNLIMQDMKQTGLVRFAKNAGELGPGWVALNKPEFRVFAPPSLAEHFMSFDAEMREGLRRVAEFLGIDINMPLTDRILKGGARGYTARDMDAVVARFGTDDGVLQHEIGHQLDFRYKLSKYFEKDKQAWKELGDLAMLREPSATGSYQAYLLEPTERIANLFNAYWHTPQILQDVAPTAFLKLNKLLDTVPDLGQVIRGVKPSVRRSQETILERGIGPQYVGQYFAKEPAFKILDNYLSKGLRGNGLYDAIRQAGNGLNQVQLSWAGFHAMFVSFEAIESEIARGLERAIAGEFGKAAKSIVTSPFAVIQTYKKGRDVRAAYLNPELATPEYKALADALAAGGGRIKMDDFYRAAGSGSFIDSWKNGRFVEDLYGDYRKGPFKAFTSVVAKTLDAVAYPVMDVLVPHVKLGVHANLAEDWLRRNPGAGAMEFRNAMGLIQDSVDNRLGQMVYDNLFWSKTTKDLAFLSVRSVGWNLGTIRELGGGVVDIARATTEFATGGKPEMTYRMAYVAVLPIVVGSVGAMMTYMMTARPPEQLLDYFFPPTGGTTPKGAPERVNIPSYMKDVFEYNHAPVQTLINKTHPIFSMGNQMFNNRDYYGAMIADPNDDNYKWTMDWLKYIGKQMTPFALQSYGRLEKEYETGQSKIPPWASLFGIATAPASITDPNYGLKYKLSEEKKARRLKAKEEAQNQ